MAVKVRQVTDSIWTFSRPFLRVNLFKFGGRATAVRLSNGDVFLLSPVEPDDSTKATLDKIGKVKYLVAPDVEVEVVHTCFLCVASSLSQSIQGDVPRCTAYWNGGTP